MKIAFALLVIYYASLTEATYKHLKAKLKLPTVTRSATYRYEPSPVPVPVPVVYSSPVSTFSTHTLTYNTAPHYAPAYSIYKAPTYSVPIVYRSQVAVPVAAYRKPLAIYEEPVAYEEPEGVTLEASAFGGHLIESHYSTYGQIWDK